MTENYEKLTINVKHETYKKLKGLVVILKNNNQTGKVYKTATRDEVAQLVRVMMEQKEFVDILGGLVSTLENSEVAKNGNKGA